MLQSRRTNSRDYGDTFLSKWKPSFVLVIFMIFALFSLQMVFFYIVFSVYSKEVFFSSIDMIYSMTNNIYTTTKATTSTKMKSLHHYNIVHLQARNSSKHVISRVFGELVESKHSDLRYRSSEQVRTHLSTIFSELPSPKEFLSEYKNPCWRSQTFGLSCIPYVYLLGQPKCGTSDLFVRITSHGRVAKPRRKEIRWFTRGEFTYESPIALRIGPNTSLHTFSRHFILATRRIILDHSVITIDGGPHTLWSDMHTEYS